MRYLKMFGLAAVAAGALMAFIGAGTASATVLCSTTADPCPAGQSWPVNTALDFSIPAGASAKLVDTEGSELNTCTVSTVKGSVGNTGSSTTTTTGAVSELTWPTCTWPTTTKKLGNLEVHKIAGTSNGTVTADGTFEVTILTFPGSCIYGVTSGTDLGEITEGTGGGGANPATFHANAVAEEFTSNFFCPNTARWTATYTVTSPAGTTLSVSGS